MIVSLNPAALSVQKYKNKRKIDLLANPQILRGWKVGKYLCTDDLQFDGFGFDQKSKSVVN